MFLFVQIQSFAQVTDTLVDVNGHKLHFTVREGKGVPILFESGGGQDSRAWESILEPIYKITGATLITYDREGFGKSTVSGNEIDISKHRIEDGIDNLEIGLKKLGYNEEIMLVSHSYGGYYTSLFASRNPELVKSIVLIDVNHKFVDKFIEELWKEWEPGLKEFKNNKNLGMYYMGANIRETIKTNSNISIPKHISVVNLVSEFTPFKKKERINYWKQTHNEFIKERPNTVGITANGTSHNIWQDNPNLVITTIAKSYAETQKPTIKTNIYKNTLEYAIESINFKKQYEITIRVTVPNSTDEIYVTGNQEALASWNPKKLLMEKVTENVREISLKVNFPAEFKFTKGDWKKEANVEGLLKTKTGTLNIILDTDKTDLFEYVINSWTSRKK